MPKALRDMHPWRRALAEHGLTYAWLAERTGVSVATVQSYALDQRRTPPAWLARAEAAIADHIGRTAA